MIRVFLILILFTFFGCKTNKDVILKINNTEYPVIIKYSHKHDIVYSIKFPFELEVYNNSFFSKRFIAIDYEYNPYRKGVGLELYLKKDTLCRLKPNKKRILPSLESKKYVIKSRYRIDRFDIKVNDSKNFTPYIEKMLSEGKDTLHIGTVQEFKINHKELFKKLTKGDSISIQFLDGKELGERITVPLEW